MECEWIDSELPEPALEERNMLRMCVPCGCRRRAQKEGKFGFKTERQSVKFSHMSKGSLAKNVWEALWHSGWTLQGHSHQRRCTGHCEQSRIFSTKSPFPNKMSPQHPEHRSISTWEPDSQRQVAAPTESSPVIWVEGTQMTNRLICKWKDNSMSRCIQGNLNYPCPSPREILRRSSVLCISLCLTADGPRALPFTRTPLTSSFRPAPQAVFLPHLSSGQLPSFQLLGPKPQSSWILFFLSYPTSNQLVGSPGSFTFKTESDSKPLHSSPATTHLQTTSGLNYSFSLFFYLVTLCGTWDLSSPTRDRTCAPCIGSMES